MAGSADNLAKLQYAYRRWDECKGKDTKMWTELLAPNACVRSLGAGAAGLEFTLECRSSEDVARYFAGLARDWEMVHYTTRPFAVDGDRIVMLGSTSWRHRGTGRVFDTPKADLVTFRDGRVVEYVEFYDTAMMLSAARS
jgi:ketosteroid isomerase-like protein